MTRLRRLAVESPGSIGGRFRERRWRLLLERFPDLSSMNVVDLGGRADAWLHAPVKPRTLTILNLSEPGIADDESVVSVTGDACNAAEALVAAGIVPTFDLVYCNSVIEHVGGHLQRTQLAHEVQRLAPRHWVQTPYRYFPVEPHWVCPLMQFLPVGAAARVAYSWPLAYGRPASLEQAREEVMWTELQSVTQMRTYFPSSLIARERIVGVTKSLIAISIA